MTTANTEIHALAESIERRARYIARKAADGEIANDRLWVSAQAALLAESANLLRQRVQQPIYPRSTQAAAIATRAESIAAALRADLATTPLGVRWLRTEITALCGDADILAENARPAGSTSVICTLDLALTGPQKALLLFYLGGEAGFQVIAAVAGRQGGKASARADLIRRGLLLASPQSTASGPVWLTQVGQVVARHLAATAGERPIP